MRDVLTLQERDQGSFGRLLDEVRDDYRRHEGDWGAAGFRALVVYRLGVWQAQQGPVLRSFLRIPWALLYRFVRTPYSIDIHHTASIGRGVRLATHGPIVVMPGSAVGDRCVIRHGVTIGGAATGEADEAPILEEGVELGAGATIAGRVRIGEHARIGPNVVVTRDVPAHAVVFAPQPRIIFTRTDRETAAAGSDQAGD